MIEDLKGRKNYEENKDQKLEYQKEYNEVNKENYKQKWFVSYIAQTDKKLAVAFLKLDTQLFRHAGIIARLLMREQPVAEKELEFLAERTAVLTALTEKPEPVKIVVKDD